jgi:uncharacterized repeat protein (TIGR03809 family)
MAASAEHSRDLEIIARWRDLTERQVASLVNMYETGRWTRYYGEAEFRALMRESMAAVTAWKQLDSICRQIEPRREAAAAPRLDEEASSRALQSLQRFSVDFTRRGGG